MLTLVYQIIVYFAFKLFKCCVYSLILIYTYSYRYFAQFFL